MRRLFRKSRAVSRTRGRLGGAPVMETRAGRRRSLAEKPHHPKNRVRPAGAILTFCFAMLEVSDSLAMEARFAPITRGIYEVVGRPSPDSANLACAPGVPARALPGGGLLPGSRLMGRRLGSFFRA